MEDMLGFTPSKQMFNDSLSLLIDSQKCLDTFISGRTSKFGLIILIFLCCLLYQVVRWILFIFENNTISTIILKIGFKIPIVNWKINKKLRREYEFLYSEMSKIFHSNSKHLNEVVPEHPLKVEVVKEEFSAISNKQVKQYSTGMHSGTVYHSEEKVLNNCIISSMENFCFSNAFDYSQHNSMVQMEYDILNIVKNLFNGDDDTYVLTTTGGTESIIAAIAAYKFWARAEKGITKPNLVFYASAHAAFIKGCSYMDIEQRIIPLDKNGVAIPNKIHQYVDSNTIAIVCTACNYAHGTIDDVAQIASIAADYNVGCHVDNCLGGFVNCFIEYLNKSVLPFDFRTRGVTSISADTHKYGYGPKGMSTLMFRPKKLLDYLMFISVDHSGAPFVMRNLGTNRSGAVVAGTWSALMQNSLKGYILKVKRIQDSTKKIRDAIREIPELVLYSPNNSYTVKAFVVPLMKCFYGNMVCFDGVDVNPISVSSKIRETKDWHLNELMLPSVCHFLVMESNLHKIDNFIVDLKEAVDHVKSKEKIRTYSYQAFYGAIINITDRGILDVFVGSVLDCEFEPSKEKALKCLDSF